MVFVQAKALKELSAPVSVYLSLFFVAKSLAVKPETVVLSKMLFSFANNLKLISFEDLNLILGV